MICKREPSPRHDGYVLCPKKSRVFPTYHPEFLCRGCVGVTG